MADAPLSRASIELEADQSRLDRGLDEAEKKTKRSGEQMERNLDVKVRATGDAMGGASRAMERSADQLSRAESSLDKSAKALETIGKVAAIGAALEGGLHAIEGSVSLVKAASAAARDDWAAAAAAIESASASLRSVPVAGQAFGIGNAIGEWVFGDRADAQRIRERGAQAEARLQQHLAKNAAIQRQLAQLERRFSSVDDRFGNELALASASPNERGLVAVEQRNNARIEELVGQRRAFIELAEAIGKSADEIDAMMPDYDRALHAARQLGEIERQNAINAVQARQQAEDQAQRERVIAARREEAERRLAIRDRIALLEARDQRERELLREQQRLRDAIEDTPGLWDRALLLRESSLRHREIEMSHMPDIREPDFRAMGFSAEEFRRLLPGGLGGGGKQKVEDEGLKRVAEQIHSAVLRGVNSARGAVFGR